MNLKFGLYLNKSLILNAFCVNKSFNTVGFVSFSASIGILVS